MLKLMFRLILPFSLLMIGLLFWANHDWRSGIHSGMSLESYTHTLQLGAGKAEMQRAINQINRYRQGSYLREWHRRLREQRVMLLGIRNLRDAKILNYKANREMIAGDTEQAILTFNKIAAYLQDSDTDPLFTSRLYENLAIAYMRLGEQQNCVNNPHASVCIVPIDTAAVHQLQEDSKRAIDLYEHTILPKNPDDFASKWLLNLAYMTLGEYPEKVPAQHLLPMPGMFEHYHGPSFVNVADILHVDDNSMSGSVIIEDFNGDDLLDIFTSSWSADGRMKLYLRKPNGEFEDVTLAAGLADFTGGLNAIQGDFNNDGHMDIFVTRGAWVLTNGYLPNSLLKNNGDGTFTDITVTAGLLAFKSTQSSVFTDLNNDGWLDLVVVNESFPRREILHSSQIYINNQDGTFSDVASQAGFKFHCIAKAVTAGDYNNDGRQDLYVSCLDQKNYLYQNNYDANSKTLILTAIAQTDAKNDDLERTFASWFWDFNNDGHEDLFVMGYGSGGPDGKNYSHYLGQAYAGQSVSISLPRLYQNNGQGILLNNATALGLNQPIFGMGANFGDFDNDGWLDIYIGTGATNYKTIHPNVALWNQQGQAFTDISGASGLAHIQKGHGIAFADLDHDGDQDIYAQMGGAFKGDAFRNALFENTSALIDHHWLVLNLVGERSNRDAIGARIRVDTMDSNGQARSIYRTVNSGGSFGSASFRQHIGLGSAQKITKVQVYWPASEVTQVFNNAQLNQAYRIYETQDQLEALELPLTSLRPTEARPVHHHH